MSSMRTRTVVLLPVEVERVSHWGDGSVTIGQIHREAIDNANATLSQMATRLNEAGLTGLHFGRPKVQRVLVHRDEDEQ